MTTEDHCYECTGYGDDYWDEESQQYVNAFATGSNIMMGIYGSEEE